MKRPVETVSEPTVLNHERMWQFCDQLSIATEVRSQLMQCDWEDSHIIRAVLELNFPREFEVLVTIESVCVRAQNFVQGCFADIFALANHPTVGGRLLPIVLPPITPTPSSEEEKKKKGREQKKSRGVDTTTTKLVGGDRADLIRRHTSGRDILGEKDYGQNWLSKFVVIGTPMNAHDVLSDFETYTTIYHCCTQWGMEEVITILQDEGHLAFGIRDDSNKSEECVRYKVITNEPFLK